jgi:hypothetical protein
MSTEDYGVEYPAYEAYFEETEEADENIIDHILDLDGSEQNVQYGLTGLIQTILHNDRYAADLIPSLQRPIQRMLDMGARFRIEDMRAIIEPHPNCDWEAQRYKIVIKACLLGFLHHTFDLPIPNCILDAEILDDETMEYNECELENGREFYPTYCSFFHTYLASET